MTTRDASLTISAGALPRILQAEQSLLGVDVTKAAAFLKGVVTESLDWKGTIEGVSAEIIITPDPPKAAA